MKKKITVKKEVSNEDLARMVAGGFEHMDKQVSGLQIEVADLKVDISDLKQNFEQKIGNIEHRLDDVVLNRATREEVHILSLRVSRLENKIVSGTKK